MPNAVIIIGVIIEVKVKLPLFINWLGYPRKIDVPNANIARTIKGIVAKALTIIFTTKSGALLNLYALQNS